jgi:hypothetical protein
MNTTEREQSRLSLLRYMDSHAAAGRRFGLSERMMLQQLRSEGHRLELGDVVATGRGASLRLARIITPN